MIWGFNRHNVRIGNKGMRFLEVKLYDKMATSLESGISIIIDWQDSADGKENILFISRQSETIQSKRKVVITAHGDENRSRSRHESPARSPNRLLPTDRLVLNALRARVPQGAQVTKPVRLQELIEECEISRSQVRICLKRLTEKGLVNRLDDGVSLGSQDGYSYKLSQKVL
jgi:DNA-binding MarR family transcriptional regulator